LAAEPQRGDRFSAWGVSPREPSQTKKTQAAERRQMPWHPLNGCRHRVVSRS